jgi:hypothetical protein
MAVSKITRNDQNLTDVWMDLPQQALSKSLDNLGIRTDGRTEQVINKHFPTLFNHTQKDDHSQNV